MTNDHTRIDERSLALHGRVAEKLSSDPALLGIARQNIVRWQSASDTASPALAEWRQILDGSLTDVIALMTERSERATRLRQSSPFAGVLTEAERLSIYSAYRRI